MSKIKRRIISILVENHSGVLSRIAGLFTRRGYNIDSLSVGETMDPNYSRMTVALKGDDYLIEQMTKQLNKLIDVVKVIELESDKSVYRELVFIKVNASSNDRASINETVNMFRAKVIDVSSEALIIECTGDEGKISALIDVLEPFGIIELVRTGFTGLERGKRKI